MSPAAVQEVGAAVSPKPDNIQGRTTAAFLIGASRLTTRRRQASNVAGAPIGSPELLLTGLTGSKKIGLVHFLRDPSVGQSTSKILLSSPPLCEHPWAL